MQGRINGFTKIKQREREVSAMHTAPEVVNK